MNRRFPFVPSFALFLLAFSIAFVPFVRTVTGQHSYRVLVVDAHEESPLDGVNVSLEGAQIGSATDADGMATLGDVPPGRQTIVFSFIGYERARRSYNFPLDDPELLHVIRLREAPGELEEIAISATRTSRTIADQPTRVETIAGEEIDEKISMEPSNISMLLNESPGITVQQTSATSGNASIRIQGLDGRYTQILKDGFPLYGGFSGGLSVLQIPPLDLQQVEVIKGPASTLYGGDAIAGLINLVSRTPTRNPELSLLANATTAGGVDVGGFYAGRGDRLGLTFLASGNLQRAYDPDEDAFTNLPRSRRLTLNPKLFFYAAGHTTVSAGLGATIEERQGGDVHVIRHGPTDERTFLERNESRRVTSQVRFDHRFERAGAITLKHSLSFFDREVAVPGHRFEGAQIASYAEASMLFSGSSHDLVAGFDVRTDRFDERRPLETSARDYGYISAGGFIQNTWDVTHRMGLETGMRGEYHGEFGFFALPRASFQYRLSDALALRAGGGFGYKAPTVFLEASEGRAFRGVMPLSDDVRAEKSLGGSVDLNYRTVIDERLAVSVNQAFYFTNLRHPLVPDTSATPGLLHYRSADGSVRTHALETNARFELGDWKLFLGYVYLDARDAHDHRRGSLPLTPAHKVYSVLVFEVHGAGRVGLEAYYTGTQRLPGGGDTEAYWVTGLMAERRIGPARFFVNFENFLGTLQSDFAPVVLGPRSAPRFADIWAPTDGFIVNGGVKYVL